MEKLTEIHWPSIFKKIWSLLCVYKHANFCKYGCPYMTLSENKSIVNLKPEYLKFNKTLY